MNYKKNMSGIEFVKFRVKKDLSQSQIGRILGVSVVTVKSWEHQRRNIPLSINNFIRLSIDHVPSKNLKNLSEKLKKETI